MVESRHGSFVALVGGIHLLLVFATWTGTLLHPPAGSTWVSVGLRSSSLWLALCWSGILLTHLGLGIRSGYVEFADDLNANAGHRLIVYSAVGVSVYGLLATIVLSVIAFH